MNEPDRFVCPVCGYQGLKEPPRPSSGGGSYEFCPCCDFEFGVTDDDLGISDEEWRKKWVSEGMPWRSRFRHPPKDWDPIEQLRHVSSESRDVETG
jgi:hypothetical protein